MVRATAFAEAAVRTQGSAADQSGASADLGTSVLASEEICGIDKFSPGANAPRWPVGATAPATYATYADGFDPRTRIWYQLAKDRVAAGKSDIPIFTPPY